MNCQELPNCIGLIKNDLNKMFSVHLLDESDWWGKQVGATHKIAVRSTGLESQFRVCKLKKTVIYVAIDEADGGGAVWEKWSIKDSHYWTESGYLKRVASDTPY